MEKKLELCFLCGGTLQPQTVTKIQTWKGELRGVVENVPAYVCNQCGEKYFDGVVLEQIDSLLQHKNTPVKQISIPLYRFQKTEAA